MAVLGFIIPQLMNCGQNCHQAFSSVMDQDWNHWKLQMQTWMEDAKQAAATAAAHTAGAYQPGTSTGQSCGASSGPTTNSSANPPNNPLEALHQMWTQFQTSSTGRPTPAPEQTNNQVNNGPKKLVIKLDVQHFEPQEISVKIVDNHIVVSAEHPERTDRLGLISRKFTRRYELPDEVESDTIVSALTADGVLIIEGLKKVSQPEPGAQINIPVIREQTTNDANQQNYSNEQQMD